MNGLLDILAFGSAQSQAALREILWIALKGAAVLAAAFAAALLLRRSSASLRHLAWAASFAVLAALPAWTILLPAWELELGVASSWNQLSPTQGTEAQGISAGLPAAASSDAAFNAFPAVTAPGSYPAAGRSLAVLLNRPDLLLALWLLVASVLLLRWAAGYVALRRSIARSRPLRDPEWQPLLARLCARLGLKRPVDLRLGASRLMPLTWGIRRPGVLLPAEALSWEKGKREIVLLHELAHVRRRDVLIQHISALVSALYWFNPLVWAAWRRLRREREGACDDLVLSLGTRPSEYARQLLSIAHRMRSPGLAMPALSMAHRSQLEGRLLAILDPQRVPAGAAPRRLLEVTLLVILMAAPLAALSPALGTEPEQARASASQSSRTAVQSQSTAHSSSSREGSRSGTLSHSQDGTRLEIRMEGVRISNDYTLAGIDPGGYLEIVRRGGEGRQRLEIEPSVDGGLTRSFFVDGKPSESQAEAEELLQEAMQTMRGIDHDRERVHGELEQVRQAQANQEELERSRQQMEIAMREAEQALAESHREHRVQLEATQRQLEESLREAQALREEEMRRLEDELRRSRDAMESSLKEAHRMREIEMSRMEDEMRRMEHDLELQHERLRDELSQEQRRLEVERERLHEVRQQLREAMREAILQALGATELRNDPQAWGRLREAVDDLPSEILSEGSSIRVDEQSIRFSASPSILSDRIRHFLDRALPGGLSGLDQGLRNQLQETIGRLSRELSAFTLQR